MRSVLLLLIAAASGICQIPKPEDKCSIEGVVLNAVTGEAVKKANIVVNPSRLGAISDAAGHFKIEGIDPGHYVLLANRTGFVDQVYGTNGPNQPGAQIILTAGQKLQDITFKLTPQGVITGRVTDEDGDPISNALLQCQRYVYNRGRKVLFPVGPGVTNDLGEYRIFGLRPGKYYVAAQNHGQHVRANITGARADHEEGYASVYYPNSPTPDGATPVEIAPGAQVHGIDLTISKTHAVRIRGQVVNGLTNKPVPNASVSLSPRDNNPIGMMNRNFARSVDSKGTFEIHNVVPGSYFVIAQIFENNKSSMARISVDVGTSNIDDLHLVVNPTPDITGYVIAENKADTTGASFNINLEANNPGPFGGGGGAIVKEDGSFTIGNILPDIYAINVAGLTDNFYLKSVRFGDNDITDSGVDFTQGVVPGELTVILSANGGQMDGTVQNENSEPVPAATVVLIPAPEKRSINRLYKNVVTGPTGKFSIKGIAPGEYKLFAWEQVESGSYQDPDFLKPYESRGESVSIQGNSHENKQLKLIPAGDTVAQQP